MKPRHEGYREIDGVQCVVGRADIPRDAVAVFPVPLFGPAATIVEEFSSGR